MLPKNKPARAIGTTFSFSVDQTSRVTFTFRHTSDGRRVGNSCVAKTPGTASKPHCTRVLTDGTLHVQAPTGTNSLHFEGPISRLIKLKPGSHSVMITATNPAGIASASQILHFTITSK